jgi:hypothetical protein
MSASEESTPKASNARDSRAQHKGSSIPGYDDAVETIETDDWDSMASPSSFRSSEDTMRDSPQSAHTEFTAFPLFKGPLPRSHGQPYSSIDKMNIDDTTEDDTDYISDGSIDDSQKPSWRTQAAQVRVDMSGGKHGRPPLTTTRSTKKRHVLRSALSRLEEALRSPISI